MHNYEIRIRTERIIVDQKKIQQLKARRKLLQAEILLKHLRERISSQLSYLTKNEFDHSIYYEHENLNWIIENLPLRKRDGYNGMHDYQIDAADCDPTYVSSEDLLTEKIREQVLNMLPKGSSIIICYDGGDPEIEISIEAFLSRPSEFLCRPETWALAKDRTLIIEQLWLHDATRFIQIQHMNPILVSKLVMI